MQGQAAQEVCGRRLLCGLSDIVNFPNNALDILFAEGRCAFADAFALVPELSTEASQVFTALGESHLGIGYAVITPSGTPVTSRTEERLAQLEMGR